MNVDATKIHSDTTLEEFAKILEPIVYELFALVQARPLPDSGQPHGLNIPGFHVSSPMGHQRKVRHVVLDIPAMGYLTLQSQYGALLTTSVKTFSGRVQRQLKVSAILGENSDATQTYWQDDFAHAHDVLRLAIAYIVHDTPLDGSPSWPCYFRHVLMEQSKDGFKFDDWTHWIEQRGTPEMLDAMSVADGLVDRTSSKASFEQWKECVCERWQQLEMITPSMEFAVDHLIGFDHGQ